MKRVIILASLFIYPVFSAPMADKPAICYLFENNSLKEKGNCVISHGFGAGGDYTAIDFNGENYLIEGVDNEDGEREYTLNDEPVIEEYTRDTGFYTRIEDSSLQGESLLFCTKSSSLDICYLL